MPSYRNLKRKAEDLSEKAQKWNEVMVTYNDQIEGYNELVAEHNAWMDQIKTGQGTGLAQYEDGTWAQLGSHNGDYAWSNRNKDTGKPYDNYALLGSRAELDAQSPGQMSPDFGSEYGPQWQANNYWVRNGDGTATKYTGTGSIVTVNPGEEGYVAPIPQWGGEGSGVDQWMLPDGSLTTQNPNVRQELSWVAGDTLRIAEFNEAAPVEPDMKMPKMDFTNSQINELNNPHLSGADALRMQAMGKTPNLALYEGESSVLSGDILNGTGDFKPEGILQKAMTNTVTGVNI